MFPGTAIVGFPPGTVTPPYTIYAGTAVAGQAQSDLTTAYDALEATPATVDLTGQDLGGQRLTAGVYNFDSSAQLTGTLVLDAQGDPDAVFIFDIGSTLTTASASTISLIGGAQGQNVLFRVGSSATLGTDTLFIGEILALTSITLTTGANITCGAALARNGAVTLDTNTILIPSSAQCLGPLLPVPGVDVPPDVVVIPPDVVVPPGVIVIVPPEVEIPPDVVVIPPGVVVAPPGVVVVVPPGVDIPPGVIVPPVVAVPPVSVVVVTDVINSAFLDNPEVIPQDFLDLAALSPIEQREALIQLSGEVGTAVTFAGFQAMDSFLNLVLNPGSDGYRTGVVAAAPPISKDTPPSGDTVRVLGYGPQDSPAAGSALASFNRAVAGVAVEPRLWEIWAAGYGGHSDTDGDTSEGTHDRSSNTFGVATGFDYRFSANTEAGFALSGGGINFDLSDDLGSGHSDMLQAALYSRTDFGSAYIAGAVAYAYHHVSTDRYLTFDETDHLTADFSAQNFAGHIESGYRFGWFTPYAALRAQAFKTPSYEEESVSGPSTFALAYEENTATVVRTELGAQIEWATSLGEDATLALHSRAAWARSHWSDPSVDAAFLSLSGAPPFSVAGALPDRDAFLVSAGAEVGFRNGFALSGVFDGQFAENSQSYSGSGRVIYRW